MSRPSFQPTKRAVLVSVTITAAMIAGAAIAVAATGGAANHPREREVSAQVAGAAGPACKFGFDTQTGTVVPPDDSTANNPPAGSVGFAKPCAGPVRGSFTSELDVAPSGFIHIDMTAECVSSGGFPGGCTPGGEITALPGHVFLRSTSTSNGLDTHGMDMVWPSLPPGVWRFRVRPGGDGASELIFRTFTVDAYKG